TNVRALTNGVHPVVMSFSCLTGSFQLSECFGETWLRDEAGGLAFYGSSVTSYWDEDDILERAIYEGAFAQEFTWLGGMFGYGMQALYVHYGGGGRTHRYFEQYNLLGDPSLDLYTSAPDVLPVSHAGVIIGGAASFTVNVGQDGALVALTRDGVLLGAAVSLSGVAVVPIAAPVYAGEILVTVTRHNFLPYEEFVTVAAGSQGVVSIQQALCPCEATLHVALADSDLADAGLQSVVLTSDGGDAETLVLAETGLPGVFEGEIDSALGVPHLGNGLLEVDDGQVVTVTYQDLDDGTGSPATVTDHVLFDCSPPTLSTIQVMDVDASRATLCLDTDEPATVEVRYGLACGALTESTRGSAGATSHSIMLRGLEPNTEYFYIVDAWDVVGNQTAAGPCRSFITADQPDYFTELFGSDNDLSNMCLLLVPDGSADFYTACIQETTALPVNPADSATLALGDDDSRIVSLGSGAEVSLYGMSYDHLYVGSNGYITFGDGDTTYRESLLSHFALPRVAGLFDDLNPSSGGRVSWSQLPESVVVTYQNVPQYGTSSTVTFQIQLFFDGAIQVTWLEIDVTDGLAGISAGQGVPEDFIESDLTAYPECDIEPPGSLHLAAPNGGEVWLAGAPVDIFWEDGNGDGGDFVRLLLYEGSGGLQYWLTRRTPNDGHHACFVPVDAPVGGRYKVRVQAFNDPGCRDVSDDWFDITHPPLLVTSPAFRDTWTTDEIVTVTWQSDPSVVGEHVRVGLHRGADFWGWVALRTENNGAFDLIVPIDLEEASKYRIRLQSYDDPSVRDFSRRFTVVRAPLAVTAPARNAVWISGSAQTISWLSSHPVVGDHVRLWLHQSAENEWFVRRTENNGAYEWIVPNVPPASNYKIRVQSYMDNTVRDYSPRFTIAEP
ncbi:MAG TPA: hypothetical protein ENN80_03675, partial [Candidatus Hydrogenedentes bacterium]|nr:hypothetical protein [Candidatus Hydrogenedentota bacterium]